jgi:hypothetical protein
MLAFIYALWLKANSWLSGGVSAQMLLVPLSLQESRAGIRGDRILAQRVAKVWRARAEAAAGASRQRRAACTCRSRQKDKGMYIGISGG